MAAGGLGDGLGLYDEGPCLAQITEEQLHAEALHERDGKQGQRARLACEPHLPIGQRVPARVVAQGARHAAREPQPAQCIRVGHRLVAERPERAVERRRTGAVALGRQHRHSLEQQVAGARQFPTRLAPVRREDRLCDVPHADLLGEPTCEECCRERVEDRSRATAGVERLELLGSGEQQRRRIASSVDGEADLGSQQLRTRALEVVEGSRLGHHQELQGAIRRAGLVARLRGGQRAARAWTWLGREDGGTLETPPPPQDLRVPARGRPIPPAPPRRPRRAPQSRGRDARRAVRLGPRVGRLGERPVHAPAVVQRRRPIHGRSRAGDGIARARRTRPSLRATRSSAWAPNTSNSAACHTVNGSPTGSAEATSNSSRVAGGSRFRRLLKLASMCPESGEPVAGAGASRPARRGSDHAATRSTPAGCHWSRRRSGRGPVRPTAP